MSRKSKRRNRSQSSFMGALLIESIAVMVMIGLFFAVQKERMNRPTVDEFVHPTVIEDVIPNLLRPYYASTDRSQFVSTGRPNFQWRDPMRLRQ